MKQDVQNVITKPGTGAEPSVPAPTPPPAQAPIEVAALAAEPVGFAEAERIDPSRPVRVRGSGHYDDGATFLLDNRIRAGRVGIEVYTLFRPDGGATPLLVDRGWLVEIEVTAAKK